MIIQLLIVIIIVIIGPTLTSINLSHAADDNISQGTDRSPILATADTTSCPIGSNCNTLQLSIEDNIEQVDHCSLSAHCSDIYGRGLGLQGSSASPVNECLTNTCTHDILVTGEIVNNARQTNSCQETNPSCTNFIFLDLSEQLDTSATNRCAGLELCTNLARQTTEDKHVINEVNNCSGVQTCDNSIFQQGFGSQEAFLLNSCENTECTNGLDQKLLPSSHSALKNNCSGSHPTSCTNTANQFYDIRNNALLENDCTDSLSCDNTLSQLASTTQVQNQLNECTNADCTNNSFQIAVAENSFSQINECSGELNMPCGTNTNQEKLIDQKSDQTNSCFESTCTSTVVEDASLNNAALSSIQASVQKNGCLENSQCENQGVLEFVAVNSGEKGDQSLNQNNLCINESNCINNGSVKDGSGSNTQSNKCIKDSSCSNTGVNNENICVKGATCDNSGTNSKIISIGDPCENTSTDTKVICTNGRIITRPS